MADAKLERIYTVPLAKAYEYLRTRRTERAVKVLREFVAKHMKVELENVRISEGVNKLLWRDSIQKPPRRIKVRVVKEGEKAKAWLLGEEEEMKKIEDAKKKAEEAKKKAAEAKAKPAEKKAEEGAAKAEGAKGADAKQPEAQKAAAATGGATPKAEGKSAEKAPAKADVPKASAAPAAKMQDVKRDAVKPKTA